jgi:DNA-nicking Smr family endonuclease
MILDLHGIKHLDAYREIDKFLWNSMQKKITQVEIITGKSLEMKSIVKNIIDEYGFSISMETMDGGSLIISL